MKLVRYSADGTACYGILDGPAVHQLVGDPFGSHETGAFVGRVGQVQLLSPCAPSKIIAMGLNYHNDAQQRELPLPAEPIFCLKPPTSIIGPGAAIRWPPSSQRIDFEGEIAVVIGEVTRDVEPADARFFGLTCANDVTARDLQRRDGQWSRAKGFDTFCPLGPSIVTGLDVLNCRLITRVNGDVRQATSTADLHFSISRLVSYLSKIMTLLPGDVILTGTPTGSGPLSLDDVVEIEVEGVGILQNVVGG